METRIAALISPAFYGVHKHLRARDYGEFMLKGGRGSAKSSYASIAGLYILLRHPRVHGVVMRKVSNTLRATVFAQYCWAIDRLGLSRLFKKSLMPMALTYMPTGQTISFFGADDAGKLKSLKAPFGYVGYLHIEEMDQFEGEQEIRSIEQSVLRGGDLSYEIKTFNPPRSADHWANRCCIGDKTGRLVHHSSYLDTPKAWLGRRFLTDAEHLMARDYAAYEHEYLGIPNGTGGKVFANVEVRGIAENEMMGMERSYHGVDFGFYPDPWTYVRCQYDAARRRLFIVDEATGLKLSNAQTAEILKGKPIAVDEAVICDSAEPKSVADYRAMGIRALSAEKPQGSLLYSMKWLQSLDGIVIDQSQCPHAAKEFLDYAYDKAGGYPDGGNHFIDAARYAMNMVWRRAGM